MVFEKKQGEKKAHCLRSVFGAADESWQKTTFWETEKAGKQRKREGRDTLC
jgi:hypothetical protein